MKEAFEQSVEELKRVDHLFYVSLKYTRTVDVIKNVIHRQIACIEFGFEAILRYAKENKKITEIPSNVGLKYEVLKKIFPNDAELLDFINFYSLLKKIIRAPYTKKEEFRKHVTMIATVDNEGIIEVNIEVLKGYYMKTRDFVTHIRDRYLTAK